jgi:starch-binding outer membrane protein, SusD/RagB family
MKSISPVSSALVRSHATKWTSLLFLTPIVACKVSAPDITPPSALESPAGALALRDGALDAFATAYGYQTLVSGEISDELSDRGFNQASDIRKPPVQSAYPFDKLSSARVAILQTIPVLEEYNPSPGWRVAELYASLGYIEVFFAENMCSGVPLAQVTSFVASPGPVFSRSQMLQRALADFDTALSRAAGSDSIRALAFVGRARALLDSGNVTEAALNADSVTGHVMYEPPYSSSGLPGNAFAGENEALLVSVSNREGTNGLNFIDAVDPRVPTSYGGQSQLDGDSVYLFQGYQGVGSPIPLASTVEARLIAAEALLPINHGNGYAWLDTLNALRTNGSFTVGGGGDTTFAAGEGGVQGLSPLTDPGSDNARVDLVFRERAFWLYATGHRQGDLRRLIRFYKRATESVFPTGLYQGGPSTYGTATNFVPFGEAGNPYYSNCIDQNP